jgi:hypothetical protein
MIGSRDAARAEAAAVELASHNSGPQITGAGNPDVAKACDVVVVSVPYDAQRPTLEALTTELAGKIVIDVVAPLSFRRGQVSAVRVEEGSAAQQAQTILPDARVVAAFQNISAQSLLDPAKTVDCDVIVCADDAGAKTEVMRLAELIRGVRAVDGGALENARYVEDFTALLLNINRIYRAHSMVKISGI